MAQQAQSDYVTQSQNISRTRLKWLRRTAGAGVFLYLVVHVYTILLIFLGPDVYTRWSLNYQQPLPRLVHLGFFFCLLVYTLDSARTLIIELHPNGQRYERLSLYLAALVFFLVFIPSAILIVLDTVIPY